MEAKINPITGRAIVVLTDEERKAKQNAQYKKWRETKLETDPAKLEEYRRRKNEASKRCIAKKKAKIAELEARLAELEAAKQ